MIPLKDILPSRRMPAVVIGIIAVNVGVWFIELSQGINFNDFIFTWGFIPRRMFVDDDPQRWMTIVTSMFMHGGWMHIIGNMWFLWIFGDNVEDVFGHFGFVLFYLACGLGAAILQFLFSVNSTVPMVGASGAVSGVLGAYACFFPNARIIALIPIFFFLQIAEIPAIIFIFIWFAFQLLSGCTSIGLGAVGGVAWWAHIGGFGAGWFIAKWWKKRLTGGGGGPIYRIPDGIFTFRTRRWR